MATGRRCVGRCLFERLEGDAGTKLELSWIVGGCRSASLCVKEVYVQSVVVVNQVEDIGGHLQRDLVREGEAS